MSEDRKHEQALELYQQGKPEEAILLLSESLGAGETSAVWNDWATIQIACGQPAEAEQGYCRALELNPQDTQAMMNLGLLLAGMERHGEAAPLLEAYIPAAEDAAQTILQEAAADCRRKQAERGLPDLEALATYLHAFVGPDAHSQQYFQNQINRYLGALDLLPAARPGQSLLEVGASFHHLTPALARWWGYEVRCSDLWEGPSVTVRNVESQDGGEKHRFHVDNFDVQRAPWPYREESFDAILFLELLEHLNRDPMLALAEMNRILKEGGILLLSTPNITSARGVDAALRGESPYFWGQFEVDGLATDHHNREYTPGEVARIAQSAGFEAVALRTLGGFCTPSRRVLKNLVAAGQSIAWRGEDILLLARKAGPVRDRYPAEFYARVGTQQARRMTDTQPRAQTSREPAADPPGNSEERPSESLPAKNETSVERGEQKSQDNVAQKSPVVHRKARGTVGKSPRVVFSSFRRIAYPILGIGYLVSNLRKHGLNWDYQFVDSADDIDQAAAEICKLRPDILGLTTTSVDFGRIKKLAAKVREDYDPIILLGGAHTSSVPETLPPSIDVGFLGEAEETAVEVFQRIRERGLRKEWLQDVRGIAFFDDQQELVINPGRPVVKDLDTLPRPARDVFPPSYWESGVTSLITSRGCPYRCAFCQAAPLGTLCRYHSAGHVGEEIQELVEKYGIHTVGVVDDLFVANRKRIRKITEELKERGLLGKVRFSVSGRANLMCEELVQELIDMGVANVSLGLESMSPRIHHLLKDKATVEENRRAVDLLHRMGLKSGGLFMIGTPTESIEDMEVTFNYIRENRQKFGSMMICVTTPLPQTKLWEMATERGLVCSDVRQVDWERFDMVGEDAPNNLYIGDVPIDRFARILAQFKTLCYTPEVIAREKEQMGESDAFYDATIDAANASLYGNPAPSIVAEGEHQRLIEITGSTTFRMVGLFNEVTISYRADSQPGEKGAAAMLQIDDESIPLPPTEGRMKTAVHTLNLSSARNRKREIKNVRIEPLSPDCRPMLRSLAVDFLLVEDNAIAVGKNEMAQIRSGKHPTENWQGGSCFWTQGTLVGCLQPCGGENRFVLEFLTGKKTDTNALYHVEVGLFDEQTGRMLFSKKGDFPQVSWRHEIFDLPEALPEAPVRFVITSDCFVPRQVDHSADCRTLGIAVKSIAVEKTYAWSLPNQPTYDRPQASRTPGPLRRIE